uniref:Putative amino acid permease n=2 Tax=Ixodes ricinus TaxID=34613 RepID=A0A147BSS2_IXORI
MARRRNSEILWSLMTRIKSPHSLQVRRASTSCGAGAKVAKPHAGKEGQSQTPPMSASKSRLCLVVSAIAPGLTFGVFVVVGNAAAVVSAGAVVPSLLVAAVASLLAGLCLIELVTSQRPCPDSLYACLYQWAGEAAAFSAGWLSLLHQGAAVACVARLQSSTIDSLSGGALGRAWQALGSYDPVALALGLTAASLAAAPRLLSAREPTWLGLLLIGVSVLAALFFVAMGSVGATAAPGNYWSLAMLVMSDSAPTGLLSGAALCMYAFIGPHTALRRAPESPRPSRDLPLAVGLSTALTFLLTFAMAVVVTLQARQDAPRPLAAMLASCSADWAGTAMAAASLVALAGLTVYGLLPLGGAVRSLAADGLLFRSLAKVSSSTGTPVGSILAAGALASVAALVIPVRRLLGLMAAGPLVLNAAVCIAVLLARYHPPSRTAYDLLRDEPPPDSPSKEDASSEPTATSSSSEDEEEEEEEDDHNKDTDALVREYRERLRVAALTDVHGGTLRDPTSVTARRSDLAVAGIIVSLFVLSAAMELGSRLDGHAVASACAVVSTVSAVVVACLLVLLSRQPQATPGGAAAGLLGGVETFRVPMVPWLPAIGAFLSICLLVDLLVSAWLVFLCWVALGAGVYLLYGIHSSTAASEFPLVPSANGNVGSPRQPSPKISLRPMAMQPRSMFVSHIVPSHRSHPGSQRRLAELDTVFVQH